MFSNYTGLNIYFDEMTSKDQGEAVYTSIIRIHNLPLEEGQKGINLELKLEYTKLTNVRWRLKDKKYMHFTVIKNK